MESLPSLPDGSALPHRLSNPLQARHGPFCFTGSTYLITTRAIDYGFTAGGSSPLDSGITAGGSGHTFQCSRKRALAPCELLRCIRAPPSAGRTRTLGCSTLRRNTESQSYNNQISYDSIEAESPAGPTRRIRALTSASRTQTLGRSTPRRNAESRFTRRSNQLRFHSDKPGVPDA